MSSKIDTKVIAVPSTPGASASGGAQTSAPVSPVNSFAPPEKVDRSLPVFDPDLATFAQLPIQISGRIQSVDPDKNTLVVEIGLGFKKCVTVQLGNKTNRERLRNLQGQWQPAGQLQPGMLVMVEGVILNEGVNAVTLRVVGDSSNTFDVENPQFLADRLRIHAKNLKAETFGLGDVTAQSMLGYRTYLGKTGDPTGKTDQEGAVLSRTLYGFLLNALINHDEQALKISNAVIEYMKENFRYQPAGEDFTLWNSVVRPIHEADGTVKLESIRGSTNYEDAGQIPLYEQVYILAGLTNHFLVTRDPETLNAISGTLRAFWKVFHDKKSDGFVSHIDPDTLKPITSGHNAGQINWNSTGDFGPAVLRSLISALGPESTGPDDPYNETRDMAMRILLKTTDQIITHFPDPQGLMVRERFHLDWSPNLSHPVWQEDRAVVGHNAKIAWNLSSYAALFRRMAKNAPADKAEELKNLAGRAEKTALDLGKLVIKKGVNQATGGIFDVVERNPHAQVPLTWSSHTDWWQQEQLILMAASLLPAAQGADRELMLETLRRASAFYFSNFSNHEEGTDFFRVNAAGQPITTGEYGNVTGHSKGFYHSSELYTLLMRLNAAYVTPEKFTHHYSIVAERLSDKVSVLPDFFVDGSIKVDSYRINGKSFVPENPFSMEIQIPSEFSNKAVELQVFYQGVGLPTEPS